MTDTFVTYVTEHIISCQGSGPDSGHPRVFLNLGKDGKVVCPYCSNKFMFKE